MPRDRLDGIKTKAGRVVYDRKKHPMTDEDRARIAGLSSPEAKAEIVDRIVSIVDSMTEEMVAVILARFGVAPGLADELVEELKKIVGKFLESFPLLGEYLKEARGPFGIPGEGVF